MRGSMCQHIYMSLTMFESTFTINSKQGSEGDVSYPTVPWAYPRRNTYLCIISLGLTGGSKYPTLTGLHDRDSISWMNFPDTHIHQGISTRWSTHHTPYLNIRSPLSNSNASYLCRLRVRGDLRTIYCTIYLLPAKFGVYRVPYAVLYRWQTTFIYIWGMSPSLPWIINGTKEGMFPMLPFSQLIHSGIYVSWSYLFQKSRRRI